MSSSGIFSTTFFSQLAHAQSKDVSKRPSKKDVAQALQEAETQLAEGKIQPDTDPAPADDQQQSADEKGDADLDDNDDSDDEQGSDHGGGDDGSLGKEKVKASSSKPAESTTAATDARPSASSVRESVSVSLSATPMPRKPEKRQEVEGEQKRQEGE